MRCWIVVNGALKDHKFQELHQFIKVAAEKQQVQATIIPNHHLMPMIKNHTLALGCQSTTPDFVLFMDKDIYLANFLEKCHLRVFNSATAIDQCDNKMKTSIALASAKIDMPTTILAPFIYEGMTFSDQTFLDNAARELGYPLIIKEAYGSFGEQVYLIHNEQELLLKVAELGHKPFLLQKFISSSYGKDIRINIVGNKFVAAMLRENKHNFRANANQGGTLSPYTPTTTQINLAIKATAAVGADFAGVDLLFGPKGPLVCEINSNSHLLNIYYTTGINVADAIIEYCVAKVHEEECF